MWVVEVQMGGKTMEPSKRTGVDPEGRVSIQKNGRKTSDGSRYRQEDRRGSSSGKYVDRKDGRTDLDWDDSSSNKRGLEKQQSTTRLD